MPPRSLSAAAAFERWGCGSAARRGSTASATAAASGSDQVSERRGGVGAVLGLGQEVEREQHRVGRVVGDDQALGRSLQDVRHDAVLLRQQLRDGHRGLPGPTILRTRGMRGVPSAAAAMPLGPLTRYTSRSPSCAAM